ncbi:MAG: hypothetical protein AB8H03_04325 [Saprospiraceae bacterium]
MRNKLILSLGFLFFVILPTDAQSEKISLPTFSFTVPDGMKNHSNNSDVLAKLSFENSLHITIDDNMEKMLELTKKRPRGSERMKMEQVAFDLKFKAIKDQYRGFDATKKQTGKYKNFNYTSQMFTCKASKTQAASLEYRVMEIGEKYYEFIITGKNDSKKKHLPLIIFFWKSIVTN